jgi:hypothetical protein
MIASMLSSSQIIVLDDDTKAVIQQMITPDSNKLADNMDV